MDYLGRLIPRKKIRTKDKTIIETVNMMIEHAEDGTNYNGKCFICHSDCLDDAIKVKDLVEKPSIEEAPSNVAILGRYIITPAIFDILENQEPGKGGEIQLTDALKTLATHEAIYAYDFEGRRYDVGDKLGFLEATIDFALKRPELRAGLIEFLQTKAALQLVAQEEDAVEE